MTSNAMEPTPKIGAFPYVMAGLCFIPLIGAFIAVPVIIYGFVKIKIGGWKLSLIALAGIAVTVGFYGFLFYSMTQKDGPFDKLRGQMAQNNLNEVVKEIEYYKMQNGHYPEDLKVFQKPVVKGAMPEMSAVYIMDTSEQKIGAAPRLFYYQPIDRDHYYLLGVGPDGVPFTGDDIVPTIDVKNTGLVIKDESRPHPSKPLEAH